VVVAAAASPEKKNSDIKPRGFSLWSCRIKLIDLLRQPLLGGAVAGAACPDAASSSCEGLEEGYAGPSSNMATAFKDLSDSSGSTRSRGNQERFSELSRLDLVERTRGWLDEFDRIIDYAEFDDPKSDKAHRRVTCVRRTVAELDAERLEQRSLQRT